MQPYRTKALGIASGEGLSLQTSDTLWNLFPSLLCLRCNQLTQTNTLRWVEKTINLLAFTSDFTIGSLKHTQFQVCLYGLETQMKLCSLDQIKGALTNCFSAICIATCVCKYIQCRCACLVLATVWPWTSFIPHLAFWGKISHRTWSSPFLIDWLAHKLQETSCLNLLSTEITSAHHRAYLGLWGPQSLLFVQQTLHTQAASP